MPAEDSRPPHFERPPESWEPVGGPGRPRGRIGPKVNVSGLEDECRPGGGLEGDG